MIHPIIRYADGHTEPLQILGFCGLEVDGKSYSLEELQELLGKPKEE